MHDVIKNFSGVRVIMEANKSEAERCLEIAKKALKDGDLNKARRFANKSLKLCSTQQAEGKNGGRDFISGGWGNYVIGYTCVLQVF